MVYMVTFTINIPAVMLAYIPYMDPMGNGTMSKMDNVRFFPRGRRLVLRCGSLRHHPCACAYMVCIYLHECNRLTDANNLKII